MKLLLLCLSSSWANDRRHNDDMEIVVIICMCGRVNTVCGLGLLFQTDTVTLQISKFITLHIWQGSGFRYLQGHCSIFKIIFTIN